MNRPPSLEPDRQSRQSRGGNGAWAGLLFLIPVLCCGGPFIVAALATAGAVARGLAVGLLVAVVAGVVIFVIFKRPRERGSCCAPMAGQPRPSETRR